MWDKMNRPERIAAIRKELATRALSARDVAWALGATRNAVIGYCNRHRIQLPGNSGTRGHKAVAEAKAIADAKPVKPSSTFNSRKTARPRPAQPKPLTPGFIAMFPTEPPPPPHKSFDLLFINARLNQCRWLTSPDNTLIENKTICGHDTLDGPWCEFHRGIVYLPASTINEQRRAARASRAAIAKPDDRMMKPGAWAS